MLNFTNAQTLKRGFKTACTTSIILAFSSMNAMAFDGDTRGECYDYVVSGCNEEPECTGKELGWLLDSCDAYPESDKVSKRPTFKATPSSKKVINSVQYKQKIKRLSAAIRR